MEKSSVLSEKKGKRDPMELIDEVIGECPLAAKHCVVLCAILKAKYGDDADEAIEIVMQQDADEYDQLKKAADELVPYDDLPSWEFEHPPVKYTPNPSDQGEKEEETGEKNRLD